jgi:hypothetical protein
VFCGARRLPLRRPLIRRFSESRLMRDVRESATCPCVGVQSGGGPHWTHEPEGPVAERLKTLTGDQKYSPVSEGAAPRITNQSFRGCERLLVWSKGT